MSQMTIPNLHMWKTKCSTVTCPWLVSIPAGYAFIAISCFRALTWRLIRVTTDFHYLEILSAFFFSIFFVFEVKVLGFFSWRHLGWEAGLIGGEYTRRLLSIFIIQCLALLFTKVFTIIPLHSTVFVSFQQEM